jgi:hypothetical protein
MFAFNLGSATLCKNEKFMLKKRRPSCEEKDATELNITCATDMAFRKNEAMKFGSSLEEA